MREAIPVWWTQTSLIMNQSPQFESNVAPWIPAFTRLYLACSCGKKQENMLQQQKKTEFALNEETQTLVALPTLLSAKDFLKSLARLPKQVKGRCQNSNCIRSLVWNSTLYKKHQTTPRNLSLTNNSHP